MVARPPLRHFLAFEGTRGQGEIDSSIKEATRGGGTQDFRLSCIFGRRPAISVLAFPLHIQSQSLPGSVLQLC